MNFQIISTQVHGFIDYATSLMLPIVPRLLGFDKAVTHFHDGLAIATAGQSVMTNYELGAVKVLPMSAHLAMDALAGGAVLATAALMRKESPLARGVTAAVGLFYIANALMTQTQPYQQPRRRMQLNQPGERTPGQTVRPGAVMDTPVGTIEAAEHV